MSSRIDKSLQEMVRSHIGTFFSSLQEGNPALKSFLGTLSSFNNTLREHRDNLRAETLIAVNNFVSLVGTVTSDVLELETTTDRLSSKSASDFTQILSTKMAELTIQDSQDIKLSKAHPAYVKPAYQWLLLNLHNPYPSKETKKEISRQTHCPIKDIDAWFIDTRKRIGWNKLRKTRFSNKQEKIIAAATDVFRPKLTSVSADPNASLLSELNPRDSYRGEFLALANQARLLYADRFPELVETLSYGHPGINMPTLEFSQQALEESTAAATRTSQTPDVDPAFSYPTPDPSSPSEFGDDLQNSTDLSSFDKTPPKSLKRRQSQTDLCADLLDLAHPSKRPRAYISYTPAASVLGRLPSPSPTIESGDEQSDVALDNVVPSNPTILDLPILEAHPSLAEFRTSTVESSTLVSSSFSESFSLKRKRYMMDSEKQDSAKDPHIERSLDITAMGNSSGGKASIKRKRRLSDGANQCPHKRPHNALAIPRLYAVSDPFPMSKLWDDGSFEVLSGDVDVFGKDCSENSTPLPTQGPLLQSVAQEALSSQCDSPPYAASGSGNCLDFLVSGDAALSIYAPEPSGLFSESFDPSFRQDTVQNSSTDIVVTTTSFPDFNTLLSVPEYNLSHFDPFSSFDDDLSCWFSSLQSGHSCAPLNLSASALSNIGVEHCSDTESLDVKKARLLALKAQVSQLEGQLANELVAS